MKLLGPIEHITIQGRVSQIFDFCNSFNFMIKKQENLGHLVLKDFLHLIKFEIGHKYKISDMLPCI